jgi:hypothetical protein
MSYKQSRRVNNCPCDGADFTVDGMLKYKISDTDFFNNISIKFLYTLFKRIY